MSRKRLIALALLSALTAEAGPLLYSSNFGNNTVTAYDVTSGVFQGTVITAGPEVRGLNGVRLDSAGNFLVTGQDTNSLVRYDPGGALISVFDPGNLAGLSSPQDLTFGPDGKLYVASGANDRILRYDPLTGAFIDTFADLTGFGHLGPVGVAFGSDGKLYVSTFDDDRVVQLDGTTGAVLNSTSGPPGLGFGPVVSGPDGNLYVVALNLSSFAGSVYRYDPETHVLSEFIPESAGGLAGAGGIAFDTAGSLLVSSLVADVNFNDAGSSVLRYDAMTGAFQSTLVPPGNALNFPFFLTVANPVPEPQSAALLASGLLVLAGLRLIRQI